MDNPPEGGSPRIQSYIPFLSRPEPSATPLGSSTSAPPSHQPRPPSHAKNKLSLTEQPLLRDGEYSDNDEEDEESAWTYGGSPSLSAGYKSSFKPPDPNTSFGGIWRFVQQNQGILYVFVSCFPFVVATSCVKALESGPDRMPAWEVVFVRMLLTVPLCTLTGKAQKLEEPVWGPPDVRKFLWMRGIFGFIGAASFYSSLRFLPASEALVISFVAPIVTGCMASITLNESLDANNVIAAFTSLFGVFLIAKPPFLFSNTEEEPELGPGSEPSKSTSFFSSRVFGVAIGLFAVFSSACANIFIRHIGHKASPLHFLQYFAMSSVLGTPLLALFVPTNVSVVNPLSSKRILKVLALSFCAFLAQLLLGKGIQHEKLSRCLVVLYIQLPMILLVEIIIFKQSEDALSLLGSVIILASAIFVAVSGKSDDSK